MGQQRQTEQNCRQMVDPAVNRELARLLLWAAAGAAWAGTAPAREAPKGPSVAIDAIEARGLLSSIHEQRAPPSLRLSIIDAERAGLLAEPAWRIERDGDPVTGTSARFSLPVGSTTIFAVSGKLHRRIGSTLPDPVEGPSPLTSRKMDSGRIYGGGVERTIGPVELSAAYQYSRISGENADDSMLERRARSHSARATARIRFRP
jgi:hypothetical protein